jgi:polysaccharide biosynthesis transport protein
MNEETEVRIERIPSKPFDPIGTVVRHWLKIAVFGSAILVLLFPVALIKEKPYYIASGKLLISPSVQTLLSSTENNPIASYYSYYVQTECERISSQENLEKAIEQLDPNIKKIFMPNGLPVSAAASSLASRMKVEYESGTHFIAIGLEGDTPEGLAEVINKLMDVYLGRTESETEGQDSRRISYLLKEKESIEQKLTNLTETYRSISAVTGTVNFEDGGNIQNTLLESLQQEYVAAYSERIKKEHDLTAAEREAEAILGSSIDADVDDFVLNSDVASQIDLQTYQQIQTLQGTLEGLADDNPDRKIVEDQIANLTTSLDYSKNILKEKTHQVFYAKRESKQKEKLTLAKFEFESAKSAEEDVKKRLDQAMSERAAISNKIIDGQQIQKQLEELQALLSKIADRINMLRLESRAEDRISIDSRARLPKGPSGSNMKKLLAFIFVFAFGSVFGGCVLFDILDKRIRSRKNILDALGAKVTWPISNYLLTRTEEIPFFRATRDDSSNVVSKAIHSLSIRLDRERRENNTKLAVFTGVDARSGTSEILVNVAYAMTRLCKRVLVIDANLINPSFDRILLENSGAMGLVEHMREEVDFSESIIRSPERQFDVLPAGQLLLMSEINLIDRSKFPPMFDALKDSYDLILVDTPPILVSDFTEFLLQNANIVSLVVQGDRSKYDDLFMIGDILKRLQVRAIAVVLNWGGPRERNLVQIYISRLLAPITKRIITSPLWNVRHIEEGQDQGESQIQRVCLAFFHKLRLLYHLSKSKMMGLCIIGGMLLTTGILAANMAGSSMSDKDPDRFSGNLAPIANDRIQAGIRKKIADNPTVYKTPKTGDQAIRKAIRRNETERETQNPVLKNQQGVNSICLNEKEGPSLDHKMCSNEVLPNDLLLTEIEKPSSEIANDYFSKAVFLSKPSSYYTIQMMGADDATYLVDVAKKYGIEGETAIFKKKNGSTEWYVLFYKLFSDRSDAMACVEALMPELKVNHPWVRVLGDIRKEITENEIRNKTGLSSTATNSFAQR